MCSRTPEQRQKQGGDEKQSDEGASRRRPSTERLTCPYCFHHLSGATPPSAPPPTLLTSSLKTGADIRCDSDCLCWTSLHGERPRREREASSGGFFGGHKSLAYLRLGHARASRSPPLHPPSILFFSKNAVSQWGSPTQESTEEEEEESSLDTRATTRPGRRLRIYLLVASEGRSLRPSVPQLQRFSDSFLQKLL